ncbi:MAG: hypothetical protein KGL39_19820 [Patescibacteria group bacterium]|nr:hypothetical protein [Patescibacteria group bacterium]
MNLILQADGLRHATMVVDDKPAPNVLILPVMCQGCQEQHEAVYEFKGMHDDGLIYDLKGVQ